jgi:membrane associated rhomboid family serine protease
MKAQRSATIGLITIICGFFLWQKLDTNIINNFYLPPLADMQSYGQWYRLFTVALMHDQTSDLPYHLAFNMLALYSLGTQIETVLGRSRFLVIFFISLLAGSITSAYFLPFNGYSIGASGAVFGLFGATLAIYKKYGADLKGVLVTVGLNLAIGFTIPGIDWRAHIGGLIGGAVAAKVLIHK